MNKFFKYTGYMALTLIILNILDALTTITGLKIGCYEGNFLMRPVVGNSIILLAIKIIIPSLVALRLFFAYKKCNEKMKSSILWGLRIMNIYYLLVVCLNSASIIYVLTYGKYV